MVLSYIEQSLILVSAVAGYISVSTFASLVGVPIDAKSSAVGLHICRITAVIKRHKSIIKKKEKKQGKIVLLTETKLSNIEPLISKVLIDSDISQDEFV